MTVTRYLRGGGGTHANHDDNGGGWAVIIVIICWAIIVYPQVFSRVVTTIVCCLPQWILRRYRKCFQYHQNTGNRPVVPSVRHKIPKNPIR